MRDRTFSATLLVRIKIRADERLIVEFYVWSRKLNIQPRYSSASERAGVFIAYYDVTTPVGVKNAEKVVKWLEVHGLEEVEDDD